MEYGYRIGPKRSEQKNECRKCTKPGPGKCRHGVACWFQHRCWYIDSHTTAEKEMWAAEERLRNEITDEQAKQEEQRRRQIWRKAGAGGG